MPIILMCGRSMTEVVVHGKSQEIYCTPRGCTISASFFLQSHASCHTCRKFHSENGKKGVMKECVSHTFTHTAHLEGSIFLNCC